MYEDDQICTFQLKHNTYPYRLVYTFKKTYREYIQIIWWYPVLDKEIITRKAILRATFPREYAFKTFTNQISEPATRTLPDAVELTWSISNCSTPREESFSRPDIVVPFVIVAPKSFVYGVPGRLDSWQSFGNWQYRLMEGLGEIPLSEKISITELLTGTTDKRETVKILYHYLQDQTRYINVSIGIGGFKPYPASYVSRNKYGDCKALCNYLQALLRSAGVTAYYVKVQASDQPSALIPDYFGPQFNHIVLAVPDEKDTIWLETTQKAFPFGYLGTFTQNRPALLIDDQHSQLIRIPALKTKDILVQSNFHFDIKPNGGCNVTLKRINRGKDFELLNLVGSDLNENEKNHWIRYYMPFDNYEVIDWKLTKPHRDSSSIELYARINLYNFLQKLGREYYFSLYPCRLPFFEQPAKRKLPLEIPFPICNTDTLVYNLPDGFTLRNKPCDTLVLSRFGRYTIAFQADESSITITRTLEIFPIFCSMDDYAEFSEFIQSVREADKIPFILTPPI